MEGFEKVLVKSKRDNMFRIYGGSRVIVARQEAWDTIGAKAGDHIDAFYNKEKMILAFKVDEGGRIILRKNSSNLCFGGLALLEQCGLAQRFLSETGRFKWETDKNTKTIYVHLKENKYK